MANRLDFYFKQLVTEAELDQGFAYLELADQNMLLDAGLRGVFTGLTVAEATVPNLTVQVAAGVAYDKLGQRCSVPSTQTVNVAQDHLSVVTTVTTPGNTKWMSLFLMFDRALSDPRVDGNSLTVYFQRAESFSFKVVQGAEAVSPSKPALDSEGILLADIKRTQGVTTVTAADIDTTRREWAFNLPLSPNAIGCGSAVEAVGTLLGYFNDHVQGLGNTHTAASVSYAGGGAWRDGVTNPATTVEAQLDKVVADLASNTSSVSGARKLGAEAVTGSPYSLAAGSIYSQLAYLLGRINVLFNNVPFLGSSQAFTALNTFNAGINFISAADDTVADIISNNTPAAFKLLWNIRVGTGAVKARFYASSTGELLLVYNAKHTSGTTWTRDDAAVKSWLMRFVNDQWTIDNYGTEGGATFDKTTSRIGQFRLDIPGNTTANPQDVRLYKEGYLEAPGAVEAYFAMGLWDAQGNVTWSGTSNFPKKFPSTPSSVTYSGTSTVNVSGSPTLVSASKSGVRTSFISTAAGFTSIATTATVQ